jgi:hypothetical protein
MEKNENESFFLKACNDGDLRFCQILSNISYFDNDRVFLNEALLVSCTKEHLSVCEWLTRKYSLSSLNVEQETLRICFYHSSLRGNIKLAQFLISNFGIPENLEKCLQMAFWLKNISFVAFLFENNIVDLNTINKINNLEEDERNGLLEMCEKHHTFGMFTKPVKNN